MGTKLLLVCVLHVAFICSCLGQFNPLVNVESCTRSLLVISTYEAADDGLIYIQGQDDQCKHVTSSGLVMYEFDFSACNIQWEMLFKIVLQKNKNYQTGADKVVPIFCVADRSDIIVANSNNAEKTDDGSQNITVKPSASMSFYKVVAEEEVSGQEVKLSDTLIMALELTSQFIDDFDIKARYCVASDIVIIENYCATDVDLFPNFLRFKQGYLMSEFGAFRTTNYQGSSIEMNFTCILEVCQDACQETYCGGGESGWGRKKRGIGETSHDRGHITPVRVSSHISRSKRQTENYDIDVGANVKIVEKYSEVKVVTEATVCMNESLLIMILIFLAMGTIGFAGLSFLFYRRSIKAETEVKKTSRTMTSRCVSVKPGLGNQNKF